MYEVVVVGGGPAGVTAALRARELGAELALVERGKMGGTCTNDGCVLTRVLAHAARLMRGAEQLADEVVVGEPPRADFSRLLERTRALVEEVHEKKRLRKRLDEGGVRVFDGVGGARFVGENTLALEDGRRLEADKFVLCAGGHARRLNLSGRRARPCPQRRVDDGGVAQVGRRGRGGDGLPARLGSRGFRGSGSAPRGGAQDPGRRS